jgi:hypothetical protein
MPMLPFTLHVSPGSVVMVAIFSLAGGAMWAINHLDPRVRTALSRIHVGLLGIRAARKHATRARA